jgi:MFS family permease
MGRNLRPAWIYAALSLANVTYAVAQTLLIPSIPTIQKHVHASPVGATALLSAFFISGAVTAGLIGRLADMIGKRRMMTVQLVLSTSGALICALSSTLPLLIFGRGVMGLSAALFPLSASIIRDELRGSWVTHGIASLGVSVGLGSAFGLSLGGLVSSKLGYHWIFWIQVVFGLCSMIAVALLVPETATKSPGRLDILGTLLLGAALGGPLVAISLTE